MVRPWVRASLDNTYSRIVETRRHLKTLTWVLSIPGWVGGWVAVGGWVGGWRECGGEDECIGCAGVYMSLFQLKIPSGVVGAARNGGALKTLLVLLMCAEKFSCALRVSVLEMKPLLDARHVATKDVSVQNCTQLR